VNDRRVLDLFCGAGGLASGFAEAGFEVTGVDHKEIVPRIFELNGIGAARVANLYTDKVNGGYDVVIGGPPCRPWSSINVRRRGAEHDNFTLLDSFAHHVLINRPDIFLLENVPPARGDAIRATAKLAEEGYSMKAETVTYSQFGAPTSRRRLMLFGSLRVDADAFFDELKKFKHQASTVRKAIGYLEGKKPGEVPDHVYPNLKTIDKYDEYYETGKYGWYRLSWDEPAPSFGNVMKTYTLHPSSREGGVTPRVISIREAMRLMGFRKGFRFPDGMGMGLRYQMVADSVSPFFSRAAAKAIDRLL
jgi:DNA (cytosine-5)-methyltransferase 1